MDDTEFAELSENNDTSMHQRFKVGKLNLVDLAGSERVSDDVVTTATTSDPSLSAGTTNGRDRKKAGREQEDQPVSLSAG